VEIERGRKEVLKTVGVKVLEEEFGEMEKAGEGFKEGLEGAE